MIGNFARLFRGEPRHARAIEQELADAKGEPPERFVEKISDEGGDVYVAPVLESLREVLARRRKDPTDVPQGTSPDPRPAEP